MRYQTEVSFIQVVGNLWMPNAVAAHTYELTGYDLGNIGNPLDRNSVAQWLATHSGDFSRIIDFRADLEVNGKTVIHEWESEDNEATFSDCIFGAE
jgi:hypothetical protein